jgi:hypothetical protein
MVPIETHMPHISPSVWSSIKGLLRLTVRGFSSAIGRVGQSYFGHDEFADWAPGMKTLEDALDQRARIFGAFEMAEVDEDPEVRRSWLTFVVVGGGPASKSPARSPGWRGVRSKAIFGASILEKRACFSSKAARRSSLLSATGCPARLPASWRRWA